MSVELRNNFGIVEEGTQYELPQYKVVEGKGLEEVSSPLLVNFVRGSKLGEEEVPKRTGTLHEHLLSMMIHDLRYKNSLVPSEEGTMAIINLQEAYLWLLQRQIDRKQRQVEGTYKK